jgi:hypothetical protein
METRFRLQEKAIHHSILKLLLLFCRPFNVVLHLIHIPRLRDEFMIPFIPSPPTPATH